MSVRFAAWQPLALAAALAAGAGLPPALAQQGAPASPPGVAAVAPRAVAAPAAPAPASGPAATANVNAAPPPVSVGTLPPGGLAAEALGAGAAAPAGAAVPEESLVFSFEGPEGVAFEVLGPGAASDVPLPDERPAQGFALDVGGDYRVKAANLPNRPGAEVHLSVEVVGHLHRDPEADPARFPIRVQLAQDDIEDVLDRNRMITQVIYLEDPDTAAPVTPPAGQLPTTNVSPSEDPFLLARKLGRLMAIVRIGGRVPDPLELAGGGGSSLVGGRCPFLGTGGAPCGLPSGPGCEPAWKKAPCRAEDEYLCDGGDREDPIRQGELVAKGIDPQDAVVTFRAMTDVEARKLPTNKVCIYSPRFARIRGVTGPDEAYWVQIARGADMLESPEIRGQAQDPRPLIRDDAALLARGRDRATELANWQAALAGVGVTILQGVDNIQHVAGLVMVEQVQMVGTAQGALVVKERQKAEGIKTAETVKIAALAVGPHQAALTRGTKEFISDEHPDPRPGLAVIKQVDAKVGHPGDEIQYVIRYKNVGNVPIRAVSITDSLLPRLEYVPKSARGPEGTIFSQIENRSDGQELRWDLPEAIKPGEEGAVSFKAKVL